MAVADRQAEAKPDRLFVESVARAFRVLEAFADTPEPMTLSQLAAAAGIDKSAAQRLPNGLDRPLAKLPQHLHDGLLQGAEFVDVLAGHGGLRMIYYGT